MLHCCAAILLSCIFQAGSASTRPHFQFELRARSSSYNASAGTILSSSFLTRRGEVSSSSDSSQFSWGRHIAAASHAIAQEETRAKHPASSNAEAAASSSPSVQSDSWLKYLASTDGSEQQPRIDDEEVSSKALHQSRKRKAKSTAENRGKHPSPWLRAYDFKPGVPSWNSGKKQSDLLDVGKGADRAKPGPKAGQVPWNRGIRMNERVGPDGSPIISRKPGPKPGSTTLKSTKRPSGEKKARQNQPGSSTPRLPATGRSDSCEQATRH